MIILDVLRLENNYINTEIQRVLSKELASKFDKCLLSVTLCYIDPKKYRKSIRQDISFLEYCISKLDIMYVDTDLPVIESLIPNILNLLSQMKTEISELQVIPLQCSL